MKKIIKTAGHCCDGCQWFNCDFFRVEEHITSKMIQTSECNENLYDTLKSYSFHCDLFGGVEMIDGSLTICNKVYGQTYEGKP